jgi:NRAMP (natural resistance-associated macrophage protein)-like metal ion transporter
MKSFIKLIKRLGPGIITGASDDDPSGIATYSQAGAKFGLSFLWLSLFSFPFMGLIQEICGRIGLVTGRGLTSNIKRHFPRPVLFFAVFILFFANTVNVGVDLGAMAKSFQLLFPFVNFFILVVAFAVITLFLAIFFSYKTYEKYLKFLVITLFVYVFAAFFLKIDFFETFSSLLIPRIVFSKDYFFILAAILGTTISPYLFFWQASEETEDEIACGRKTIASRLGATKKEKKEMRFDIWVGMFFSNLIMFFIILTTAKTLNFNGVFDVQTAEQAALSLKPFAGNFAFLLFALGIISTGLLSIPVLAGSSAYAVSELFGKRVGLNLKFDKGIFFYGLMILSVSLGVSINLLGINPIQALVFTAVLNALISVPLIVIIMILSNKKSVMDVNVNSKLTNFFGWFLAIIMFFSSAAALLSLI